MTDIILIPHGFQPEYEAGFANGIARNRWTVTLVGSDMSLVSRLDDSVEFLNLRGSQDPARPRWRKALNLARYWVRCYSYLARHRGTVVHVIGKFSTRNLRLSLIEARLTRLLAGPYVLTVHELLPHGDHSPRAFRLSRSIYRTAAVCITHTSAMRERLTSDFGIEPGRTLHVELGIDRLEPPSPQSRQLIRRRLNLNGDEKLVLFFGNIVPYKGLDVLLDAFDGLQDMQAHLVIAGRCRDVQLAQMVRARINASPRSGAIRWLEGFFPNEEVPALFHAADVVAIPYRGDIGQSAVLFMALATGVRIVASDVGALREYVPRGLGTVVPPNDARLLAEGIRRELCASELPRAADSAAQRFLWSAVVHPLFSVYTDLSRSAS